MDPEKSRSQALEVQTFEDLLPVRSDSPVFEPSTARQRRHHRAFAIAGKLALAYLGFYLAVSRAVQWIGGNEYRSNWIYRLLPRPTTSKVNWKSCGEGFGDKLQCANVNVPLDYRNASDERMYTVAVTRLLASDKENRKGAVFMNPGGPGGSGTSMVKRGQALARVLKNQFDLIGFDPRGVKASDPYVSCFDSQLELEAFTVAAHGLNLDLPSNVTAFPHLREDVHRQISVTTATMVSLARRCLARSGEVYPYLGTEFVVKDIDYLARLIEGEDKRINYWGFSYGTVIGQYMVKILPPQRLGRLVIDGVVNPVIWNMHADHFFDQGLQDIDNVLFSFASSCLAAGKNCSLNAELDCTSVSSLMSKIDETIDALYARPVPVFGLDIPAVATASNLRALLFQDMYSIGTWPQLAQRLVEAFKGDFTQVVNTTMKRVHAESARQPDASIFSTYAIVCADALHYPKPGLHPAPTNDELAERVLVNLKKYSHRFGDGHWNMALCHLWAEAGLLPSRSRYAGTFEVEDDTLDTPMLILSNTYDPVTPLEHAMAANQRLGNNARLIQQTEGYGHCAVGHFSYCTALATREYMLEGKVPTQKHTTCKVDQVPFQPFVPDKSLVAEEGVELVEAWMDAAEVQMSLQGRSGAVPAI